MSGPSDLSDPHRRMAHARAAQNRLREARAEPRKDALLAVLAKGLSVAAACRAAGCAISTASDWRKADPVFAQAWLDAVEEGNGVFEDELRRRAVEGTEKLVYSEGRPVWEWVGADGNPVPQDATDEHGKPLAVARRRAVIREYSDTLLIFGLKGRMPHKYRERADQQPVSVTVSVVNYAEKAGPVIEAAAEAVAPALGPPAG